MELKCIALIFMISTLVLISESNETADVTNEILAINEKNKIIKMEDLNRQEQAIFEFQNMKKKQDYNRNIEKNSHVYKDCAEVRDNSMPSGIYEVQIPKSGSSKVYCDTKTWGGPWTVILRRMDGSVNFYRPWRRYREGFGDLDGEFFLGLSKIHALTSESSQELLVELEDSQGNQAYESYGKFAIASDDEYFALNTLGAASGTAGDSLSHHHTEPFTTYDQNNGNGTNCAEKYTGGWWYGNQSCHKSNLCGKYGDNTYGKGVNWYTFRGYENSLKRVVMMIRPRKL